MADDSRPSFIPRRTPTAPKKQRSSRSIGLFGYISYILFFGSALLSIGMFIVSQQVQSTLQEKQTELSTIKNQFQQSEMNRVLEYEQFLSQVNTVFNRSISIDPLFTAVESSIVESVFMTDMRLERSTDTLTLTASVQSDSFDGALFQRSVYQEFPVLENFSLEEVALQSVGNGPVVEAEDEGSDTTVTPSDSIVQFSLTFDLDTESLPFSPAVVPTSVTAELGGDNPNSSDT